MPKRSCCSIANNKGAIFLPDFVVVLIQVPAVLNKAKRANGSNIESFIK